MPQIVVANAKEGEEFPVLGRDQIVAKLKESDMMITDGVHSLAIAGVKGGLNSGVTDDGSTVSISRPLSVTGGITATGNITGSAISASGNIQGLSLNTVSNIDSTTGNITAGQGYIKAGTPAGAPDSPGAIEGSLGYFTNLTIPGSASISGN